MATALGERLAVPVLGYDAYGNAQLARSLRLTPDDPTVVTPEPDGSLRATGVGRTRVELRTGLAHASLFVVVAPVPTTLRASTSESELHAIGAHSVLAAHLVDRLGNAFGPVQPSWRVLTPALARLIEDTLVASGAGSARVEASYGDLRDTVVVEIVQIPAAIRVAAADTVELDTSHLLGAVVLDSAGVPIAGAPLSARVADPLVAAVTGGILTGLLPGETTVSLASGGVVAQMVVTVEGVAVLVDGIRRNPPVNPTGIRELELTNGRIRLHWHPWVMRASFDMFARSGTTWLRATNSSGSGDWAYVTSSPITEPTAIAIDQLPDGTIGVTMRFDDHVFDPVAGGFPSWYQAEPFPFVRTVWLRPREFGYFSWIEIQRVMAWQGVELEVGFGGVFGPARIRTARQTLLTDTLTTSYHFNDPPAADAAEFDLYGDPLLRVLVPLPEAPLLSPVFPGWGYGSVYLHRLDYSSYGAYLYAAPRTLAAPARQVCLQAWAQAPFPLRKLTFPEQSACGPA
ncbi:MAG TPA: hypothetical protein VNJ71_10465 [Gemmatimonadales bacterium]|nr:hypothetical protein [Gemmatimonadales bacterium]